MRKIIYFLSLALCLHATVSAQYTISGKVSDASGAGISGAIVVVDGTNAGALADDAGAYSIEFNQSGKVKVTASSISYANQSQEVELGSEKNVVLNFTLANDAIGLNAVVITGVMNPKSKLESSVSVSTLNTQAIDQTVFRTTAEIFRSIPGVRSEASGGDGNTNITVRGVPISSGGSKYLQLQEDGLPVLLFGDIAFATSDIFLRADNSIARVEAIRGGSASTLSSNSPAGIINFISKTGAVAGGSIGTTVGIDNKNFRTDFNFGTPIGDDLSVHVGGFFRQGEGVRTAGYTANLGGQVKANITKRFSNGYARVYYKYLNDRTPAYMPMPLKVEGTNESPKWSGADGYDPTHGAMQSPYLMQNIGLGPDGQLRRANVADGMHPLSHSIGTEFSFDLGNNWKIEDRARMSMNSGRFVAPFPAEIAKGSALASSVASLLGDTTGTAHLAYAFAKTGATAFDNNSMAMRIHMFDTELNNMNNMVNDFKVMKKVGRLDLTAGFFKAYQNINMSWLWNSYLMDINGNGSMPLNVVDSAGNVLTQNGLYAYGVPAWGNCCQRNYNTQYGINAPYIGAEVQITDKLNAGASFRWDMGTVNGTYAGAAQTTFDVNNDGTISPNEQSVSGINNAAAMPVNYKYSYASYSMGLNYKLNDGMAVFGRYSRGGSAKADRILFSPSVYEDGSAKATLDFVNQAELGWKYNAKNYGLFVTGFYAATNEQGGFEATTQQIIENDYRALGLEVEGAANFGDFNLRGSATYTNATITGGDTSVVGNRPRRQSPFIFNLAPSYTFKGHSVGLNFIGTGSSYTGNDNKLKMPGYVVSNLYATFQITKGLTATLAGNNLLNAIGITESEETSITANQTNYVRARPILGRSLSATVRYNF